MPTKTHIDPARRAELKRQIEAASQHPAQTAGSGGTTAAVNGTAGQAAQPASDTAPARSADSVEQYGHFIHERLRDDFVPMANDCYDALRRTKPSAPGTVIMDFKIIGRASIGGLVDSAEIDDQSTLRNTELEECLRNSFLSVYFDPPPGGGEATLHYPFVFGSDAGVAEHEIHLRDRRHETAQ